MMLVGFAIVQFFTAVFGEAIENTKHLVFALVAASLAPIVLLAGALNAGGDSADDERRPAARTPRQRLPRSRMLWPPRLPSGGRRPASDESASDTSSSGG
jgi:hypothetical protein